MKEIREISHGHVRHAREIPHGHVEHGRDISPATFATHAHVCANYKQSRWHAEMARDHLRYRSSGVCSDVPLLGGPALYTRYFRITALPQSEHKMRVRSERCRAHL